MVINKVTNYISWAFKRKKKLNIKYKKVHETVFFTKIDNMVKLGNSLTVKIPIS